MNQRKLLNQIIFLTAITSVFLYFVFRENFLSEGVHLLSVKIVEGNGSGELHREGTAVAHLINTVNRSLECDVVAEIYQDEFISSNTTQAILTPGKHTVYVPILLPNGKNRVIVHAECE